jgi:hypothetical protein
LSAGDLARFAAAGAGNFERRLKLSPSLQGARAISKRETAPCAATAIGGASADDPSRKSGDLIFSDAHT